MKKIIYAKFSSLCAETGRKIRKGDRIVYDASIKKTYSMASTMAIDFINQPADQDAANMVQANEDAFFDTFCQNNNL